MPFSDYLNSLLGIQPQQPGQQPGERVIGGAVGHANLSVDDPNEPAQIVNAKVL